MCAAVAVGLLLGEDITVLRLFGAGAAAMLLERAGWASVVLMNVLGVRPTRTILELMLAEELRLGLLCLLGKHRVVALVEHAGAVAATAALVQVWSGGRRQRAPSVAVDGLSLHVELEAALALDAIRLDQILPVELHHLLLELRLAHGRVYAAGLVGESEEVCLLRAGCVYDRSWPWARAGETDVLLQLRTCRAFDGC